MREHVRRPLLWYVTPNKYLAARSYCCEECEMTRFVSTQLEHFSFAGHRGNMLRDSWPTILQTLMLIW